MPKASRKTENQIQKAVVAYRHAQNPKVSDIAHQFNVSYLSLRRRLKWVPSKFET